MATEALTTIDPAVLADLEPGWYEGMAMSTYLAIPAMSASGTEEIRISPGRFRKGLLHPSPATKGQRLGTALHQAILEPDLFDEAYVVVGQCEGVTKKGDRCSKSGTVYRDGQSFCGTHDPYDGAPMEVEVVSEKWLEQIDGMSIALRNHPIAGEYFRGRRRNELVGIWRDEATGVLCKLRLDMQIERADWVHPDLKTTTDASKEAFRLQAARLGYFRKARFYRRGLEALGSPATSSVLIAVETEAKIDRGRGPEHDVAVYLLDDDQLAKFDGSINRCLWRYAECLRTDVWPGYPTGLQLLDAPEWAIEGGPPNVSDDDLPDLEELEG